MWCVEEGVSNWWSQSAELRVKAVAERSFQESGKAWDEEEGRRARQLETSGCCWAGRGLVLVSDCSRSACVTPFSTFWLLGCRTCKVAFELIFFDLGLFTGRGETELERLIRRGMCLQWAELSLSSRVTTTSKDVHYKDCPHHISSPFHSFLFPIGAPF